MAHSNGVLCIHGAWHNNNTWNSVLPELEVHGVTSTAITLPGAGAISAKPQSYWAKPFDAAEFSTEPSPNAGVQQHQRTQAAINAVRKLNDRTGGKTVLIGHSLGGLTISPVAEAIPDELAAVVYLTAFLLPPGMVAGEIIQSDMMEDNVPSLFMADPEKIGALRIHPQSEDADYIARARMTFYADLSDEQFEKALGQLHPDEPAQVAGIPSDTSKEQFGRVPRHYIECTQDRAISIAAQREMVRLVDDAMENKSTVHTLETSHSPFYSQPAKLAQLLADIAAA